MRTKWIALGMLALLTAEGQSAAKAAERPRMEVCFVLDTTGSMGGLIQGAKDKIWSIANEMVSTKPAPEIRFGLVAYRDRTDAYVTQVHDLSEDLDDIYGKLMGFAAQGGGDTPESVNQALHEAVTKMSWSPSEDVLKIVFLVGDAPPHMDYQDDVKYPEVCQEAMRRDLIINTIQCGGMGATTPIWKEIADRGEGEYAAILQDGGTEAISTPYDEAIARLTGELNQTVVGYGSSAVQRRVSSKLGVARSSKLEAAADRADFFAKTKAPAAGAGKVISGDEDLVSLIDEGKLTLEEVDAEMLPDGLKELAPEEQKALVEQKLDERKTLAAEMEKLVKQRGDFLVEEKRRRLKAGKGDGFDLKVKTMLRKQAERKGISYGE